MTKEPTGYKMSDTERADYAEQGRCVEDNDNERNVDPAHDSRTNIIDAQSDVRDPGTAAGAAAISKRQIPRDGGPAFIDQVQTAVKRTPPSPADNTDDSEDSPPNVPTESRTISVPMATARPVDEDEGRRAFTTKRFKIYSALAVLTLVIVAVAAFVAGYCGAGRCSSKSSKQGSSVVDDATQSPTVPSATASPSSV